MTDTAGRFSNLRQGQENSVVVSRLPGVVDSDLERK